MYKKRKEIILDGVLKQRLLVDSQRIKFEAQITEEN